MQKSSIVVLATAMLLAGPGRTVPAAEKASVEVVDLALHAATETRPALKYKLLPTMLDEVPGDAAPLYMKAFLVLTQKKTGDKLWDKIVAWVRTPPGKLPREEVRKTLDGFADVLREVEIASRRTECDWALPIREHENVFGILLPELQSARSIGRLVAVRARLAIAEGKHDEAIGSLRVGFALARHVAEQPTLVSGLVGLAIVQMMAEQLEALVQSPGAPNLYWTLTALPHPMVDLQKGFRLEGATVYLMFPGLQEARQSGHSPEYWQAQWNDIFSKCMLLCETAVQKSPLRPKPGELLQKAYPIARRELIARGRPEKEVDAMPPARAVLLHVAETYDELRDETFKWFHLPYWQAEKGVRAAEKRLAATDKELEVVPLASLLLPAVGGAQFHVAAAERRLAALRCIEAIRLYAAGHQGKLPESLADIANVPIPDNPVTGKPFEYRCEGGTAVLTASGGPNDRPRREYRIRMVK